MRGFVEIVPIQDVFASGLGAIERLEGGNVRLYFYASQMADDGVTRERVLVDRIIMPAVAVGDALTQMLAATKAPAVKAPSLIGEAVH